jgi:glycosidase
MPGGWAGDERSIFTAAGRTELENEIFDYIKEITNWRKGRKSIHEGKTIQFVPDNNIYVYFRYTENEATMIIANVQETEVTIEPERFKEILGKYAKGTVILENRSVDVTKPFKVKGKTTSIIELN